MYRIIVVVLFSMLATLSQAGDFNGSHEPEERPRQWHLNCFEYAGLENVLDKLVNIQQFLRNSFGQTVSRNQMTKQGCDFAQVPSWSTAQHVGFKATEHGFIYAVFLVTRSDTRARMYMVDSVVHQNHWKISKRCGFGKRGQYCLEPKSCEAFDNFPLTGNLLGFTPSGEIPDYVRAPRDRCRTYVIQ